MKATRIHGVRWRLAYRTVAPAVSYCPVTLAYRCIVPPRLPHRTAPATSQRLVLAIGHVPSLRLLGEVQVLPVDDDEAPQGLDRVAEAIAQGVPVLIALQPPMAADVNGESLHAIVDSGVLIGVEGGGGGVVRHLADDAGALPRTG